MVADSSAWNRPRESFRPDLAGSLLYPPLDFSRMPDPATAPTQSAILRRLAGARTFRLALEASEFARSLALQRLAATTPGATHSELIREFIRQSFPPGDLPPNLR